MKKLFFFRSSSSHNGKNSSGSLPPTENNQAYWEMLLENDLNSIGSYKAEYGFASPTSTFSKSQKQVYDNSGSTTGSYLRRSRSMSSAAFLADGLRQNGSSCRGDPSRSPTCSSNSAHHQQHDHPARRRSVTPERRGKAKQFEVASLIQNSHGQDRPGSYSSSSKSHHSSSGRSSSSSNASSKVLDRYIDGDQQFERTKPKSSTLRGNENSGGRLPRRIQYSTPASPTNGIKDKTRSHSFREAKGTRLQFSSRELVENGFGHESPRRLAKNVIERLYQTHSFHKSSFREFSYDMPTTIEDMHSGSLNRCFDSNLDVSSRKSCSLEEQYEANHEYHADGFSGSQKENCLHGNNFVDPKCVQTNDAAGEAELYQISKEAEERVLLLSEELEEESFLQHSVFDVSSLIQTIRNLTEEKLSLAIEVSGLLGARITDRDAFKEELGLAKTELESQAQRLEKEKNELQSALEKELDRRSSDWSSKLEKYQLEEQRLRERIRELAEQNVSLQREVSSFSEREQQLRHLNSRVEEESKENHVLRENISELQDRYVMVEEDLSCLKRSYKEKDKECKELQKSVARLLRICSEQGKSIKGLREAFGEETEKNQSFDKLDKHITKLQMEQMRLTGVEMALRREVESHRIEIDSLRQENIILLNRLKGKGDEIGALTIKLDKEMWNRICCLQNQGLSMLKESTCLCSKLLEIIKGDAGQRPETKQGMELVRNGLDAQLLVDADIKVQRLKRGTANLARSLQGMSSLLEEKSGPVASKFQSSCTRADGSGKLQDETLEDALRCELKAETLLTSLLREKLYSKELEVEQLQAELAAAVRGNDILRSELQNAMDDFSCANHKLKDFELQMHKKDENLCRLQADLQESMKELAVIRGILSKVSEERDIMWEEVKQYNEKNLLLNSEVSILKKKIEALDEDILVKEGQITILKDAIDNSKHFDLLTSPDYTQEFLLK